MLIIASMRKLTATTIIIAFTGLAFILTPWGKNHHIFFTEQASANKLVTAGKSQVRNRQSLAKKCSRQIPDRPKRFQLNENRSGFPFRLIGYSNTSTVVNYTTDNTTTAVIHVKLHKVGSTTMACDILKYLQRRHTDDNFYLCAQHYCSLPIARSLHYANHTNYTISIQKRNALLAGTSEWLGPGGHEPIVFPSLSSSQLYSSFNIKFMTILRNPVERLRSKYYFRRGTEDNQGWCSHHKDGCLASKFTFLEWLKYYEHRKKTMEEWNICCEYTQILGGKSVDVALRTLELFDVIAFTEDYSEKSVDRVAEAFGVVVPNEVRVAKHMRDNTAAKKYWHAEERAIAERMTAGDTKIYRAARRLMRRRQHAI